MAELTEQLAEAQRGGAQTAEALREAMAAQASRAVMQAGQLQAALDEAHVEQHQVCVLAAPSPMGSRALPLLSPEHPLRETMNHRWNNT